MLRTLVDRIAAALAGLGGIVLLAMACITVTAVVFRALPGLPTVPGDFELVEMGAAIAVFSFLPWCQLTRGQVSVDLLSEKLGARFHAILGLFGQIALLAIATVVFWRLWLGFGEKFPLGTDGIRAFLALGDKPYFTETTYDLLIPVWIPHAACLPGALWWVVAAVACVAQSVRWTLKGAEA